jgi:uncharacterized cupin superfamily protein
VKEASLSQTETGLVPETKGWFVLNLRDASWSTFPGGGTWISFEARGVPQQIGVGVHVLMPGESPGRYHAESDQEGFLVLAGECVLVVEGEERPLKAWDFFHAPPWTEHVFVGAGDGPCTILAVGARGPKGLVYPVNETALGHGAGVEQETNTGKEAYARFERPQPGAFRDGDLPTL